LHPIKNNALNIPCQPPLFDKANNPADVLWGSNIGPILILIYFTE